MQFLQPNNIFGFVYIDAKLHDFTLQLYFRTQLPHYSKETITLVRQIIVDGFLKMYFSIVY